MRSEIVSPTNDREATIPMIPKKYRCPNTILITVILTSMEHRSELLQEPILRQRTAGQTRCWQREN